MAAIFNKLSSNRKNGNIREIIKSKTMRGENDVHVGMLQAAGRLGGEEDQIRQQRKIKKVTKKRYTYFETLARP